jgi:hypothetical protein
VHDFQIEFENEQNSTDFMNINVLTSTNHRSDLKRARKSQEMEIRLNIFSGQIKFESHEDYFCKKVLLNVKRGRPDATSWSCLMKEDESKISPFAKKSVTIRARKNIIVTFAWKNHFKEKNC